MRNNVGKSHRHYVSNFAKQNVQHKRVDIIWFHLYETKTCKTKLLQKKKKLEQWLSLEEKGEGTCREETPKNFLGWQ